MISKEIAAAAESLLQASQGVRELLKDPTPGKIELVARAVLADLAEREAEAKERALPIDAARLESYGFRQDDLDQWSNRYVALQCHPDDTWTLTIRGGSSMAYIGNVLSNCGQLLDLMSGLGIKATAEISAAR